jgi:hypothetical protein
MIIGKSLVYFWRNSHTFSSSSKETLIEVHLSIHKPPILTHQWYFTTRTFDVWFNHESLSLHNVIRACQNLHIEEHHKINILLQLYTHLIADTFWWFNKYLIPMSLQLINLKCKPIHARTYTDSRLVSGKALVTE